MANGRLLVVAEVGKPLTALPAAGGTLERTGVVAAVDGMARAVVRNAAGAATCCFLRTARSPRCCEGTTFGSSVENGWRDADMALGELAAACVLKFKNQNAGDASGAIDSGFA